MLVADLREKFTEFRLTGERRKKELQNWLLAHYGWTVDNHDDEEIKVNDDLVVDESNNMQAGRYVGGFHL